MKDKVLKEAKKKYFDTRTTDGKPLVDPSNYTFHDINNGEFASHERDTFFNEVYGEILYDYFNAWLNTAADEVKSREFLYAAAMSLGSVKAKMINLETKGKNLALINKEDEDVEST